MSSVNHLNVIREAVTAVVAHSTDNSNYLYFVVNIEVFEGVQLLLTFELSKEYFIFSPWTSLAYYDGASCRQAVIASLLHWAFDLLRFDYSFLLKYDEGSHLFVIYNKIIWFKCFFYLFNTV